MRARGTRGTRNIGGCFFILGWADSWIPCVDDQPGSEGRERLEREVAGLRARFERVRVITDRRRYRVFVYVFGAK